MMPMEEINIYLSTDPQLYALGASMMSQTDPWIKLSMDFDQCLKAFEGPLKEIYFLETKNNVAGFVILQTAGTFKGYIQTLCIHQDWRGKGLGKHLLQFCEDRILNLSPNIFICVSSFNLGALKLYQEVGFKLIGKLDNFVKEGFTELLLRKTVGPVLNYTPSMHKGV